MNDQPSLAIDPSCCEDGIEICSRYKRNLDLGEMRFATFDYGKSIITQIVEVSFRFADQ